MFDISFNFIQSLTQTPTHKYMISVQRYEQPTIYVDLYGHETLMDLHKKIQNKVEDLYDIFVLNAQNQIFSIPKDETTIIELIEFNRDCFQSCCPSFIRNVYNVYIIDDHYLNRDIIPDPENQKLNQTDEEIIIESQKSFPKLCPC